MKVLIIEDELIASEKLKNVLRDIDASIEVVDVIDTVRGGVEFFKMIPQIDLVFSDIQLADGLSFEIFDEVHIDFPIVFTTAYDEYSIKAFEVNSIDYLLKPIQKEGVGKAIEKYRRIQGKDLEFEALNNLTKIIQQSPKTEKRFLVKSGLKLVPKKASDVALFYIDNKVLHLLDRNTQKSFLMDGTLEELSNEMDQNNFFRINRKQLVNKEAVDSIKPFYSQRLSLELNVPCDHEIVVSREKVNDFKKWFVN